MDQDRFDQIVRALGAGSTRRAGLRATIGGLLGLGAGAATLDADARTTGKGRNDDRDRRGRKDADAARKRRRKCSPPCAAGQTCVKGQCACDNGGAPCGSACCLIGQACQSGQCVALPDPGECVAAGEPCKNVGVPCCAGRVCASGQGGQPDVACYVPKTGPCASTGDCVYGMVCQQGRCAPPQPAPLGAPCDAAAQQLCTTPGATCAPYTGPDAPAGAHCSLPLQRTCTGDPDCTCYTCWYTAATAVDAGRRARTSTNTKACCHRTEEPCAVDQDCCLGLSCVNGTCGGQICTPDNAPGCDDETPCCTDATCIAGTCIPCQGCVDAQQICQAGTTQAACGATGGTCASCTGGVRCCVTGVCIAPTNFPAYQFPLPPNSAQLNVTNGIALRSDGLEAMNTNFASGNFNGNLVSFWTRPDTTPNTWTYRYQLNLGGGQKGGWGLWLTADALTLYVAEYLANRISVWTRPSIGATNNWVQQTNDAVGVANPTTFVVTPDQLTLYAASAGDGSLKEFTRTAIGQPWTEKSSWRDPAVIWRPYGVAVSADGLTAWLSEGISAGNEFHNLVILTRASTNDSFAWNGAELQTTLRPVRGILLSPDELTLYVCAGDRFDAGKVQIWTRPSTSVQTWQLTSSAPGYGIDFGSSSYGGGVSVTPDGANMLVAAPGTRNVGIDPVCS